MRDKGARYHSGYQKRQKNEDSPHIDLLTRSFRGHIYRDRADRADVDALPAFIAKGRYFMAPLFPVFYGEYGANFLAFSALDTCVPVSDECLVFLDRKDTMRADHSTHATTDAFLSIEFQSHNILNVA